jgi:hypothetical protein
LTLAGTFGGDVGAISSSFEKSSETILLEPVMVASPNVDK